MSFWEFCYRNQTFWEEHTLGIKIDKPIKSYEDFVVDFENDYYKDKTICRPLKSVLLFLNKFQQHKSELLEMFNYRLRDLVNPSLWLKDM